MNTEREKELDGYEARYGKYVQERAPFGNMALAIGVQRFPVLLEDDPELTKKENDELRRWFKRMLCNALHNLVEAESRGGQPVTKRIPKKHRGITCRT